MRLRRCRTGCRTVTAHAAQLKMAETARQMIKAHGQCPHPSTRLPHASPCAAAASAAATSPSRAQRATTVAPGTNAAIWRRSFRRPVTALTIRPSKSKAMLKTGTRELVTLLGCRDPPPSPQPIFFGALKVPIKRPDGFTARTVAYLVAYLVLNSLRPIYMKLMNS